MFSDAAKMQNILTIVKHHDSHICNKICSKKVIQIDRVELSTEISNVKKVIQKSYPNFFIHI